MLDWLKKKRNNTLTPFSLRNADEWIDWLENQVGKQRPSEWTEKDERMIRKCREAVSMYYAPEDQDDVKNWLKSLSPKGHWRPSKKQMDVLSSLYSDLKELTE